MKKMKQILLLMTCVFVLLGTAACSSRDKADNGADQSSESGTDRGDVNDATDGGKDDNSNVNDATSGDGILDDVTADITDGVDKAADEMTEDNGADSSTQRNR